MAMSQCHKTILSQALVGHLPVGSPRRRVPCVAHASAPSDRGPQQKQASSAKDLKIALGIDKDDSKEKQEKPFWSLLMSNLQELADYVTDVTESDTSKEIWEKLQGIHEGDENIKEAKLQTHRALFEGLKMHDDENIEAYMLRVNEIINAIRGFGETIEDSTIVKKIN